MRVLVTGGSGFIGTELVRALLGAGHHVRIFDKEPSLEFDDIVVRGDVRNFDQLVRAVSGTQAVYHLAAEHSDDLSPTSLYYDVNVGGARNLARAAVAEQVSRVVFTSTVAVYGLKGGGLEDDQPTAPFDDYGKSKLEAEQVLIDWAEAAPDRSLVVVRPTVVFGEGNRGNVYNLMRQIAAKKFVMVGDGMNRKSVCYVGNLVPFLVRLLEADCGVSITNYVDKPDLTMRDFVRLVRTELGVHDQPLVRIPYWMGLLGGYAFDLVSLITGRRFAISSIRIKKFCANTEFGMRSTGLGFEPPFSVQEGLRRMVEDLEL
jgi:nucleoside-diphosphate-sugar epimerase